MGIRSGWLKSSIFQVIPMAQVFTGKVVIPGDKINEYLEILKKAEEEREPFRDELQTLNRAFFDHLAAKFSDRTARKHSGVVAMFIEFLLHYTDVTKLDDITKGIANSHFQAWYRRKVWDSTSADDRKLAIQKFFMFLASEKGIVNQKILGGSPETSKVRSTAKVPVVTKREVVVMRAKFAHNKRVYRDIELPLDCTLFTLADAIVTSVGFDDKSHAFGFYATDNPKRYREAHERYELFADEGQAISPKSKSVKQTKLYQIFASEGQRMVFLFDYGDHWIFELEVRGFGGKTNGATYPRVLASRGEAPEQYPTDDEDGY